MSARGKARRRSWAARLLRRATHQTICSARRIEGELVHRTGLGIAQFVIIGGFTLAASGWLVVQTARVLLSR